MGLARFSVVLCLLLGSIAGCSASGAATGEPTSSSGGTTPSDGGTTTPGKDGGTTATGSACERSCAKAEGAKCSGQATCVADCEADLTKIPASCKDLAAALTECAASKGTFSCNSKGKATVSAGCDDEGNALVACVLGGGKDAGADGGGSCGNLTSGSAACDSCVNQKCCAQAAACSNDAECTAILQCFGTCSPTDNACFTACENKHASAIAKEQAFYGCLGTSCKAQCQ